MLRRWLDRLQAQLGDNSAHVRLLRAAPSAAPIVAEARVATAEPAPTEVGEVVAALDQALREISEGGHPVAGLRCDVVVDDSWMLYDVVEADFDDTPRRAADETIGAALADTAGAKPGELSVRWQGQGEARQFACALPAAALEALCEVMRRHGVRPGSINGELVCAFNAHLHGLAAHRSVLAVVRPAGTQLALLADGGFAAVRYEPGVNEPGPLLDRSHALMRCSGFEPNAVTRYCADTTLAPEAAVPWAVRAPRPRLAQRIALSSGLRRLDVDLSPSRPRVPRSGWLLLAIGTLAAVLAAARFQPALAERQRQVRALHELESALVEARVVRPAVASLQDARSARATSVATRELQVPWARLLAALESVARRDVALLSVEPSALRQEVRIVAEAKSRQAMLDFLDALRAQSLREVVPVSHQTQEQAPGTPVRFEARAQWGTL